ncbi:Mitochondrial oxaloacetate carrier protein [Sorochytrium milnesiophthora]
MVRSSSGREVVKTRLQLQGELMKRAAIGGQGGQQLRIYNNAPHAFWVIVKAEGGRGIQRGLFPAYIYQILMNGTRLGAYEPVKHAFTSLPALRWVPSEAVPVLSGFVCGIMGALISSPLFLVKTRLQAHSSDARLMSVGFQHHYRGTWHALRSIVQQEGFFRGLWRGTTASMARTGVGSAVQLSSYDSIKNYLLQKNVTRYFSGAYWRGETTSVPTSPNDISLHLCASLLTGFVAVMFMNPFDVVATRLYNQPVQSTPQSAGNSPVKPKGLLYSGPVDCFAKTIRTEGVAGLYKGLTAHWLRIGPHTVLTLVFFDQFKQLAREYWT